MRNRRSRSAVPYRLFRTNSRLLVRVVLMASVVFPIVGAYAMDLSWQPQLRVGTRATDNLRSSSENEQAAWGFDTGAAAILNAESDTWRSTVTPAFNLRRFVIGEHADADEYNVRTKSQWAFFERAAADLKLDYVRDSTLTTEETDLGFRRDAISNRDTFTVQPGVRYALTDTTTLNLGLLYSDVSFERLPGTGYVDYDYKQGNVGVNHIYSESVTFFASGSVSEFQTGTSKAEINSAFQQGTVSNESKSLTYGGQAGVTYSYSDTLDGDFAVGYSQTESDSMQSFDGRAVVGFDPATGQLVFAEQHFSNKDVTTDSGLIASASIRKAFENVRARLDYMRAVSPSSRGAQTVADDMLLVLDYDLSRRLGIGFRGGYNMQTTQGDTVRSNIFDLNRDRTLLSGSLRYQMTQELAVDASYRFVWYQLSNPDRSTYNNSLFVTFNYTGRPHYYRGY